jgi:hypothetical protein
VACLHLPDASQCPLQRPGIPDEPKLGFMALAGLSTFLALGLAACSMRVKIPALGVLPDQYQDVL